jgi:hypothetical protein
MLNVAIRLNPLLTTNVTIIRAPDSLTLASCFSLTYRIHDGRWLASPLGAG